MNLLCIDQHILGSILRTPTQFTIVVRSIIILAFCVANKAQRIFIVVYSPCWLPWRSERGWWRWRVILGHIWLCICSSHSILSNTVNLGKKTYPAITVPSINMHIVWLHSLMNCQEIDIWRGLRHVQYFPLLSLFSLLFPLVIADSLNTTDWPKWVLTKKTFSP